MSAPNSTITLHPEMHREIDDSLQTSRLTRSAMLVAVSSARSSSSQRRPRAIDATKVARFSERIGRACCGDIPSDRRIAILRSVSLHRVIPPRQFCDQMSLSDNIIQKVLAFRAPLERYCPRDRFDSDCVLGTQFESSQPHQSVAARRRFPGAAPNTHVLAPSRPVDLVSGFSHSASTDVMAVLSLHPEITFPRKRRPT